MALIRQRRWQSRKWFTWRWRRWMSFDNGRWRRCWRLSFCWTTFAGTRWPASSAAVATFSLRITRNTASTGLRQHTSRSKNNHHSNKSNPSHRSLRNLRCAHKTNKGEWHRLSGHHQVRTSSTSVLLCCQPHLPLSSNPSIIITIQSHHHRKAGVNSAMNFFATTTSTNFDPNRFQHHPLSREMHQLMNRRQRQQTDEQVPDHDSSDVLS